MREHPVLFATTPWFCNLGVRDTVNVENKFADGAGMLPAHLPIMAIHSYDWEARIAIPPSILRGSSPQRRHVLSVGFMSTVCDRLELQLTDGLIPDFCDTWQYRTEGEQSLLDSMINWTAGNAVREANCLWYKQRTATNQAMFWTQPIIPENFRHLKRGNLPFFQCTVRAERRLRSDTGYFIAYHMLEAREIARDHYTNCYQNIPSWRGQFEACQSFGQSFVLCSLITGDIFAIRGKSFGSYFSPNSASKWQRRCSGKPMTAGVFGFCLPNSSDSLDCSITQSLWVVRMWTARFIRCSTK